LNSLANRFRAAEGADLSESPRPHPPAADFAPAHGDPVSRESFSSDLRTRHELRERLQVLECWKLDAGLEAPLIEDLIWHYRDTLGLTEIPTNQHDPDWFEQRRRDGDYD